MVPAQGEINMTLVPQVTNVPEGFKAVLLVPNVAIRIAGPQPTLATLNSTNVKVTVSMQGLTEGVQVVQPTISVPEGVQVKAVDPADHC